MKQGFRSVRGMHDILPDEIAPWQKLETAASEVFSAYAFNEIRIPLLERTEVFTRAIGDATDVVEKEMYSFDDRNGDSLSLRPEGTAGVVRAVLQNGLLYGSPLRLWYHGPMFRHERPQKGRTRQFHQLGAEVFGAQGPDIDAELILMAERLWGTIGLRDLTLQINTLGTSEERTAFREKLVVFLQAHISELDEATQERAARNPLRVLDSKNEQVQHLLLEAPTLMDSLGAESRQHFDGLRATLDRMAVEYEVNPRLVRGLDYYSHSVFEWVTDQLGAQGTVCAGGRYDSLVEIQGGKPWPGIGFAMGEERLVELMRLNADSAPQVPHIYAILAGESATFHGLELAEKLRNDHPGLRWESNIGQGSFKAQFKRADRSGAALAFIMGEDELAEGIVAIKYLREDRPQESIPVDGLSDWVRNWLVSAV